MAQYIIPAVAVVIVAIIEALAASERRQTKEERKKAEELAAKEKQQRTEHEHAREELMIILVQCGWASIALGEAAARALQRGHTNGDTEAALEYAAKVKHELKRFLAEQGVHAMLE